MKTTPDVHSRPVPARSGALVLFALFTLCGLLLVRAYPVPDLLRAYAALVLVFLLPGVALARAWPGGLLAGWPRLLAAGLPLSLLLCWLAGWTGRLLGWDPLGVGAGFLFVVFVLCFLALLRAERSQAATVPRYPVLLAVLAVGILLGGYLGAPTGPATDGPDHIAAANAMLREGTVRSVDALTPLGAVDRPDPRKGSAHLGLAMASALAGLPPDRLWVRLPSVLVVGWLAALAALGLSLGWTPRRIALVLVLALALTGGFAGPWIAKLGYGAHLGMVAALATVAALLDPRTATTRQRGVLAGLLLAGGAAVHPMTPAFVIWPLLCAGGRHREAVRAGCLGLLVSAPVLALRAAELLGPRNPLHAQVMPSLELAGGISMLWPPEALRLLGPAGVAAVLLAGIAWKRAEPDLRWIATWAMAAVVPALVPGVFDLAQATTSSLPIKLLYWVPVPFLLAPGLAGEWGRAARGIAFLGIVLAVWLTLPQWRPEAVRGWRPARAEAGLELVRSLPGSRVVAADPWISALIASETQHQPVTVYHQHGHPLDPDGLTRLDALAVVLSPQVAPGDRAQAAAAVGAGWVLVSGVREPYRPGFGVGAGGELNASRVAAFRRDPLARERASRDGWALFELLNGTAEPGAMGPPPEGAPVPDGISVQGAPHIRTLRLPESAAPGTMMEGVAWWLPETATAWPADLHVKLRREDQKGTWKLDRLLQRILKPSEPRTRFRAVLQPFGGGLPPGHARADQPDTLRVPIPMDLVPGDYEVRLKVLPRPLFEELSLRDLVLEADRWEGPVVGRIRIEGASGPGRAK